MNALRRLLTDLAEAGRTGALHLDDPHGGGVIYLAAAATWVTTSWPAGWSIEDDDAHRVRPQTGARPQDGPL